MKKLILVPILFISLTSVAQTQLTIQSSKEECATIVSNAGQNQEFRDQGFKAWRDTTIYTSRGGPLICSRSLLRFDLSTIPQGSFVNWARLSLFLVTASGANTALLQRITSGWNPGTVTWSKQPSTSLRGTVKLPSSNESDSYKNIDVWTLVQAMIDSPATSFGFELKLDTEHNGKKMGFLIFYSPAYGKTQFDPKLVIEYTPSGLTRKTTSLSEGIDGKETEMNIYPNPCNKTFNCKIKSTEAGNMFLKVLDMLGRTVYSQPVNTSSRQIRISLPSSSAGTYFVVLQDNKSTTIVSQELQVN